MKLPLQLAGLVSVTSAFVTQLPSVRIDRPALLLHNDVTRGDATDNSNNGPSTTIEHRTGTASRRSFFGSLVGTAASALTLAAAPQSAYAIPMVSTDEFSVILRDSPLSINFVEFSGPKSETVTVQLVDGTKFGLKDVVESSTDPRSPLKVAAACRENGVKYKFAYLESALSSVPKKKTLYTNQRVQEAAEKEKEKQERIRIDEENRLAELRRMNEGI